MNGRLVVDALCHLRDGKQRREHSKFGAFRAVIAPHRHDDILNALCAAGPHRFAHGGNAERIVRCKARPRPQAARKPRAGLDGVVRVDVSLVALPVAAEIIPIHQMDILRHQLLDLLRNFTKLRVLIEIGKVVAARQTEEHIAPHQKLEVILLCHLRNSAQMLHQDAEAIPVAVQRQIFAETKQIGLVHADVHDVGAEAFTQRAEHPLDQFIGALVTGQQDIGRVMNFPIDRPVKQGVDMGQRLDARNDLHILCRRVGVDLLQLRLAVPSAQMAEIGIIVHLIGVLHIKMQRIAAELCGQIDPALDALHRHDGVARAVEHCAKGLEGMFHRFLLSVPSIVEHAVFSRAKAQQMDAPLVRLQEQHVP